jgi:hypothetical protein
MKFNGNYIAPPRPGCYCFMRNEGVELSSKSPLSIKKFQLTAGPPQPDGAPRPTGFPSFTLWAFPFLLDRKNMHGRNSVLVAKHPATIFRQADTCTWNLPFTGLAT